MSLNKKQALALIHNVRQTIRDRLAEQFQASAGELADELRTLAKDPGCEDLTEEERRAFRQLAAFLTPK